MKKVVVITGGAEGIGSTLSKKFESKKYKVIIFDKKRTDTFNNENDYLKVDVTNTKETKDAFTKIFYKYGRIDVLANIVGGTLHNKKIENITDDDWNRTINLNLFSAFNCIRSVVPYMKINKWGRIVNISAVSGRTSTYFGGIDFTAAKAGIIGLTRQCAFELSKYGITTNAIAPGLTFTKRVRDMWNGYSDKRKNNILNDIPVGRGSSVNEQADAIKFLCEDSSSYICGAVLDTNGAMFIG